MSTVDRVFQPIPWTLDTNIAIDLDGGEHPWFDLMLQCLASHLLLQMKELGELFHLLPWLPLLSW